MRTIVAAITTALALAAAGLPALADGVDYPRTYYYRGGIRLPPERHVIELATPPWSGRFVINGRPFTAKSGACMRWAAGERIKLVSGDWNGRCVEAVFYNYWRRSRCEMWCG